MKIALYRTPLALALAVLLAGYSSAQQPREKKETTEAPKKKEDTKVDRAVESWVKTLTEKMLDRDDTIRDSARDALVGVGRAALPTLKKLAAGDDGAAATAARKVIARIEHGGAAVAHHGGFGSGMPGRFVMHHHGWTGRGGWTHTGTHQHGWAAHGMRGRVGMHRGWVGHTRGRHFGPVGHWAGHGQFTGQGSKCSGEKKTEDSKKTQPETSRHRVWYFGGHPGFHGRPVGFPRR